MYWTLSVACGALGGVVVEALILFKHLSSWQAARHQALQKGKELPHLRVFVDPPADIAAGLTRIALGALAGWLFHWEVTGVYAAVAVGAAAPGILTQLGSAHKLQDITQQDTPMAPPPQADQLLQGEAAENADGG